MKTLVASAPRSGSSYTAELLGKLGALKAEENVVLAREVLAEVLGEEVKCD